MSEENIVTIRKAIEAFNEGGLGSDVALSFFDVAATFEEPPEQPAPRAAHGREAARELFAKFDEAWDEHHSELVEIRAIDDERVLLLSIEHFQGRDGIEITQPCGTIFTLRAGKITRMQSFWEQTTALEAAGLSE